MSKTAADMTFHESYGMVRVSTLRLIRRFNVSISDYKMLVDHLGLPTWDEVDDFIRANSTAGFYQRKF